MKVRCPICQKAVKPGSEDFPFCGDRCRTIDLGNWASEKYVISTPIAPSTHGLNSDPDGDLDPDAE